MDNKNWNKSISITMLGMFTAIIFLFALTPIAFIPIAFIGSATTLHIPVIVGSLVLGPKHGAVLGFMFGMASVIRTTMMPVLSSFVFSPFIPVPGTDSGSPLALIVAFVPRILVGIVPWFVFKGLMKLVASPTTPLQFIFLAITGVVGSMTNTLLVMHLWYFLFRTPWAYARQEPIEAMYPLVLTIIGTAGFAEAILAGVTVPLICIALFTVSKQLMPVRSVNTR